MVKLYVEGGGDSAALKTACREGFRTFITKAGINNRPRVVACGSRRDAYESYCTAIDQGEVAMLLVDSEAPVAATHQQGEDESSWLPWGHLQQRKGDGWVKPTGTDDTDCHMMVQVMESWFLADHDTLKSFFGNGFKEIQLPAVTRPIEDIAKADVYQALQNSTADCKTKKQYGKGEHSFKLLAIIDPTKVTEASPWAKRFVDELKKRLDE